jgi:BirA family transcriptional regulator, biotin operon repressor / biotin---[acetyl-CoA-carboxylase] ligase
MIEEQDIRDTLRTESLGRKMYSFDTVASTNTFARSLKESDAPHGTLVIAEEQTAGKGRQERHWQSEKGKNLLFSLVLRPTFPQEKIRLLPFAAALASADAIEMETGCAVECKWPNDLLIARKKVAGMLIETNVQDETVKHVILGIGINVNQMRFGDDIKEKATSLRLHISKDVDRIRLLCGILEELEHRYQQLDEFPPQILLDEWKQRATMLGSTITLVEHSSSLKATAIDVAPNGALVIEELNGARREVFAGDVTIGQL